MARQTAATGSQSALREANSARILATVRQYGGITQVELAAATGLSPATVSTIVKQLLATGEVETRNTVRSGRRAQLVTVAHRAGMLVGVHIAPRALRIAIADTGFDILASQTLPLPNDHRLDTTLDRTALLAMELLDGLGSTASEVLGVGIGVPAPVDPSTGTVRNTGLMPGWSDIDIAQVVEARLQRPVAVDNDANLGALGEARFGAARGVQDALYVHASYNTSAALILNGAVRAGAHGTAGEIGHVLADPQGPICRCGSRGCLDTLVGARALIESLRISRGPVSLTDLIDLAIGGDAGCRQIITDAGAAIGTAVANLAVAFDPQLIVVGGELAQTETLLLDPLRVAVERRVLLNSATPLEVRRGELERRAPLHGALALASELTSVPGAR
ncbi:ROK family transcriptional regulator [Demequina capsici]|uniref:ROK family transcriptional regulator n=1 Tax=Demequina capsici TaxID=3075620 RepID=A0AA96FFR0_9MICO|nr:MULTISPECIES: ROK family transcriptional regulator [unclassified Demequina]WNM24726.1 ROK family transcriptional regulator [Demequina sp. OYTSA14]WNM27635.1 ROK family transcriptional regulator [Demequina sp. PMTSA13]